MTWLWTQLILRLRVRAEEKPIVSGTGTNRMKMVPRAFAWPSGESEKKESLACKSKVPSNVSWTKPTPTKPHATSQSTIVTMRSKSRWVKSASPIRPPTSSRRLFHLASSLPLLLELRPVLQSLDWFRPLSSVLRLCSRWADSEVWEINRSLCFTGWSMDHVAACSWKENTT